MSEVLRNRKISFETKKIVLNCYVVSVLHYGQKCRKSHQCVFAEGSTEHARNDDKVLEKMGTKKGDIYLTPERDN